VVGNYEVTSLDGMLRHRPHKKIAQEKLKVDQLANFFSEKLHNLPKKKIIKEKKLYFLQVAQLLTLNQSLKNHYL